MTLSIIGWYLTTAGIILALSTIALSLVWHRIDNTADLYMSKAKEYWAKGNKEDGSAWHEKVNRLMQIAHRIKVIGIGLLYVSAGVTLIGCLLLAIGNKP